MYGLMPIRSFQFYLHRQNYTKRLMYLRMMRKSLYTIKTANICKRVVNSS